MTKLRFLIANMALLALLAAPSVAQQKKDTVYEINGSTIVGTIVEDNPGSSLKIQVSPHVVRVLYYRNIRLINRYKPRPLAGPLGNPPEGTLGIFICKESAEELISRDPIVLSSVVGKWRLVEGNDVLN